MADLIGNAYVSSPEVDSNPLAGIDRDLLPHTWPGLI
jgi:hypothetical protein